MFIASDAGDVRQTELQYIYYLYMSMLNAVLYEYTHIINNNNSSTCLNIYIIYICTYVRYDYLCSSEIASGFCARVLVLVCVFLHMGQLI